MRIALVVAGFVFVSSAAFAQAPQVTIEDDVSPANAVKCAGLRLAQSEEKSDALVNAARDAWLQSGVDVAKAKVEAARIASSSTDLRAAIADECAPFEIRTAATAGG